MTSRPEIVQAALELARRDGLEAVTIKGLARHMGVSPNTFYNHGTTKDDILALMVEAAVGTIAVDLDPSAPWQEQLRVTMMSFHDTLIEHYVVIELLVHQRSTVGEVLFRARDAALDRITGMPLARAQAYELFNVVGSIVVGLAMIESNPVARADRFGNHRLRRSEARVAGDARARADRVVRGVIADLGGTTES